ncbi:MAG TPA: YraN family protein [Pirellulales bacterium]|jgi:putative endonuclease|nr:YraN family protein [Pirellulales bacterium]
MTRPWWTSIREEIARRRQPKPLGPRGEAVAARFLKRLGYKIVARGARGQLGELDLVAVDGRTIVFVEVKTRESHDGGHPAEAVNADKQRRLTRLALGFLKRHDLLECAARFDVVAITWPASRRRPLVEHVRNAFEATGADGMFG